MYTHVASTCGSQRMTSGISSHRPSILGLLLATVCINLTGLQASPVSTPHGSTEVTDTRYCSGLLENQTQFLTVAQWRLYPWSPALSTNSSVSRFVMCFTTATKQVLNMRELQLYACMTYHDKTHHFPQIIYIILECMPSFWWNSDRYPRVQWEDDSQRRASSAFE